MTAPNDAAAATQPQPQERCVYVALGQAEKDETRGTVGWRVPALGHLAITLEEISQGSDPLKKDRYSWKNPSNWIEWKGDETPRSNLHALLAVRSSDALEHRNLARRKSGQWHAGGVTSIVFGAALVLVFGILSGMAFPELPGAAHLFWLTVGLALLGAAPMSKSRYRDWQRRLDDAEFEVDVERLERAPTEAKADRLWRMNQRQILRYHEANLQQNAWALAVGVGCVIGGVVIVILTMTLVGNDRVSEPILTSIMGGVGAVLTNFVGAISLRMYSKSVENLESFHDKLVGTQRLTMANVVAAQVEPESLRSQTFADLARGIGESTGNGAS